MLTVEIDWMRYQDPIANKHLLQNIHLTLNDGDILWVRGTTGSGKTTFLKIITGIIPFLEPSNYKGHILLDGQVLTPELASQNISFCFQTPEYQFLFDTVSRQFLSHNQTHNGKARDIRALLASLQIDDLFERSLRDISSGQRKLIAVISSISKSKRLRIFDEPTANLDSYYVDKVIELIQKESQDCITVIASHDQAINQICNKMLHLDRMGREKIITDHFPIIQESVREKSSLKRPIFFCENISYSHPNGVAGMENLTCQIMSGESVGVIGKNGSGKTTFIRLLVDGIKPSSGRVLVNEKKRYGIVLQENEKQLFGFTVWDEILLGLKKTAKTIDEAIELLRKINLLQYRELSPIFLSGGQKQKLLVASILIHYPELIILDEPFSGLDADSIFTIIDLISDYRRKYWPTVVITDQNSDLIHPLVDRFIFLDN